MTKSAWKNTSASMSGISRVLSRVFFKLGLPRASSFYFQKNSQNVITDYSTKSNNIIQLTAGTDADTDAGLFLLSGRTEKRVTTEPVAQPAERNVVNIHRSNASHSLLSYNQL